MFGEEEVKNLFDNRLALRDVVAVRKDLHKLVVDVYFVFKFKGGVLNVSRQKLAPLTMAMMLMR